MPDGVAATVTVLEGSSFCAADQVGDIRPGRAHGLFVRDTRVLSQWSLTVDGVEPLLVAIDRVTPFAVTFLLRLPTDDGDPGDSRLLVRRDRYVGEGMREDITVHNSRRDPVTVLLRVRAAADFADLFEVKGGHIAAGGVFRVEVRRGELRLAVTRGSVQAGVDICTDASATVTAEGLAWTLQVPGHGHAAASVEVVPSFDGEALRLLHQATEPLAESVPARRLVEWQRRSPALRTADPDLATTMRRSVEDLGALRIHDPDHPERPVVAAGAPWFMALFGRDALITSWMLLPVDRSLALGTLQTLAEHQGVTRDPVTEEEPGRILHEIRFGHVTRAKSSQRATRSVYYGTADATPLFVMLLGELARWSGVDATIAELLPHADRAIDWILGDGDRDGDGFVEYERATESGLLNQGWKDSWDGITFADGSTPETPIALAEVQGYCYAAFRARAGLARALDEPARARELDERAEALRRRFHEAFWLPEHGYFALALDGAKRPVDALASNMGHCLWTGIVDDDKAAAVGAHLLAPPMFSGWGIRTLATTCEAYDPMSYHNGSVWPHDNALCAAGLRRYGLDAAAARVADAVLEAAGHFGHRLPELFCGFDRDQFRVPVPYPAACSPQAWAAAAPVGLMRTVLGLDPDVPAARVACAPEVPARLLPLTLSGVRIGAHEVSIEVDRDEARVSGLDGSGLRVVGTARELRSGWPVP